MTVAAMNEDSVAVEWSDWRELKVAPGFNPKSLTETLDGGQMFRFDKGRDGIWMGIWSRFAARIRENDHGGVDAAFPAGAEEITEAALNHLLALDRPYADFYAAMPRKTDRVIDAAMHNCEGLRIVNLPLGEALLSFLCSPMKRISQIKEVLGNIAKEFGEEFLHGIHALPTWEKLATIDENALRSCKLGYRARSIALTARMLADNPGFLDETAKLPYPLARKKLQDLPGVGGKIADCVLLYSGTAALEPFPVDTWILKAMADLYGLKDWKPEDVAHFGRVHFGPLAGLAQQFLFVYARDGKLNR